MPRIANAFKFRAADRTVLDTKLFLNLYCPILLDLLTHDDLHVPKLLILRGSPGSGKSSLLRLFETETLLALNERRDRVSDPILLEYLRDLGVFHENSTRVVGIYIDCDSSLRDIANLDIEGANAKLLNTILDMQIISGFARSLKMLVNANIVSSEVLTTRLLPLPINESPSSIFNREHTLNSLAADCLKVQTEFAELLNSFPGEPVPGSIQPHAHIFAIQYLSQQITQIQAFEDLTPLVMLDNLNELYEDQRNQIRDDFLRRSVVPRWVALRKHVYELEDLLSVVGATEHREYRELDLDDTQAHTFRRFVAKVAELRIHQSASLQQYNVDDFKMQLKGADTTLPKTRVSAGIEQITDELRSLNEQPVRNIQVPTGNDVSLDTLIELEGNLLMARRTAGRREREKQLQMFSDAFLPEPLNSKAQEAAILFASQRFDLPYYYSFDTLADVANRNVEQFLAVAAILADKMIFRAEMGKEPILTAKDQEELMQQGAENYYKDIEQRHRYGYSIRQLVDNLAPFFHAVTYRPTAPIAPGVNGFGIPREQLRLVLQKRGQDSDVVSLRRVLTNAVAGNVFFVRSIKQGQAGAEKIVFYFNRLLCVKYKLPLNTGGWQPLSIDRLIQMIKGPVQAREWGKRWAAQLELGEIEET